jgi:hypothetical protein
LSKDEDAKPWVYHPCAAYRKLSPVRRWDQDRQVAEDEPFELFVSLVNHQAHFVGTLSSVRSIKANPSKDGDAKPWVYNHVHVGQDCQATESEVVHQFSLSAFIEAEATMTLKAYTHRTTLNISVLLAILTCLFFNPTPVPALGYGEPELPSFAEFSKTVQNNQADVLRGVYVHEVLAFPIIQQPAGNAGYVSPFDGQITQFGMASQFGTVGLLAHNNLSGKFFSELALGQEVRLVYGNGKVEHFVITQVLKYQALQPTSPYSSFRNLDKDETLTAEQVFKKVYTGDQHVTFQTCISGPDSLSWGRLFVIATPKVLAQKPLR